MRAARQVWGVEGQGSAVGKLVRTLSGHGQHLSFDMNGHADENDEDDSEDQEIQASRSHDGSLNAAGETTMDHSHKRSCRMSTAMTSLHAILCLCVVSAGHRVNTLALSCDYVCRTGAHHPIDRTKSAHMR